MQDSQKLPSVSNQHQTIRYMIGPNVLWVSQELAGPVLMMGHSAFARISTSFSNASSDDFRFRNSGNSPAA